MRHGGPGLRCPKPLLQELCIYAVGWELQMGHLRPIIRVEEHSRVCTLKQRPGTRASQMPHLPRCETRCALAWAHPCRVLWYGSAFIRILNVTDFQILSLPTDLGRFAQAFCHGHDGCGLPMPDTTSDSVEYRDTLKE